MRRVNLPQYVTILYTCLKMYISNNTESNCGERESECGDEWLESGSSAWWLTPVSNSSKWRRDRMWRPNKPGLEEREMHPHFLKSVLSYALNVTCWSTDVFEFNNKIHRKHSRRPDYFFLPYFTISHKNKSICEHSWIPFSGISVKKEGRWAKGLRKRNR